MIYVMYNQINLQKLQICHNIHFSNYLNKNYWFCWVCMPIVTITLVLNLHSILQTFNIGVIENLMVFPFINIKLIYTLTLYIRVH